MFAELLPFGDALGEATRPAEVIVVDHASIELSARLDVADSRMAKFAPALAHAVQVKLAKKETIGAIDTLAVNGAASLRGVRSLTGLETLVLDRVPSLTHLRGHPTLAELCIYVRGWVQRIELDPLTTLPALKVLDLHQLRLGSLAQLGSLSLHKLSLCHCRLPPQRIELPPTLVELELDGAIVRSLAGVCPQLRLIDLWGTGLEPLGWVAQQPAVEELWLNGCRVPTLEPLLTMERPPRWILLDGDDEAELDVHRDAIEVLESRGARFMFGQPHESGIWLPRWNEVSVHECEPLYLSPGWPRASPT